MKTFPIGYLARPNDYAWHLSETDFGPRNGSWSQLEFKNAPEGVSSLFEEHDGECWDAGYLGWPNASYVTVVLHGL